jgi:hypothetical protein
VQLWVAAESQPDILEVELRLILSELVTVMGLGPMEVGGVVEFAAESCGTQLVFEGTDWVEEGDWWFPLTWPCTRSGRVYKFPKSYCTSRMLVCYSAYYVGQKV